MWINGNIVSEGEKSLEEREIMSTDWTPQVNGKSGNGTGVQKPHFYFPPQLSVDRLY